MWLFFTGAQLIMSLVIGKYHHCLNMLSLVASFGRILTYIEASVLLSLDCGRGANATANSRMTSLMSE